MIESCKIPSAKPIWNGFLRVTARVRNSYENSTVVVSKTYYEKLDVSTFRKSNHQEVWCYYKNGEIYKKYDNATDAQKDLKLTKASINDAISHRKCLKGFYFISDILRSDDIIKQNNLIYNLSDNSISRYSNGKLIQTYPSIKQAARETNSTF